MNVLERIIEDTQELVAGRRQHLPLSKLEAGLTGRPENRPFAEALSGPTGISVIAEFKRRSPSAGQLANQSDLLAHVQAYERGGAAAISVLTEHSHFGGSLADLQLARTAVHVPILQKDFIVDPYQIIEAAVAGADAILFIVAALGKGQLAQLYSAARDLDLDVLVEVHNAEELDRALEVDVDIIGINNRDLSDFSVDVERTFDLLSEVPAGKTVVSESGFSTRGELDELERVGVDAVLVGGSLMSAEDTEAACRSLTGLALGSEDE